MPYYAIVSGEIIRCVLADDVKSACVLAMQADIREHGQAKPAPIFYAAEFGQRWENNTWLATSTVLEAGGFTTEQPAEGEQSIE